MSGSRPSFDASRPAWSLPARAAETPAEVPAPIPLDPDRFEPGPDLGVGGMGRVRLMRDRWLGRQVAMKEPVTEQDASRLWHEALVTARLEHPGIVAVHDLGLSPDGVPWFAMRVVRGRSLAELLRSTPEPSARLAFLRPLLAACEAVGFAHREGVVHRDLKPANLMIGAFGEMQVIDWGLATAPGLADHDLGSAGTLGYMSPEQARGEPARATSDVWSLGAVLFEVLVGRPVRTPAGDDTLRRAAASGEVPPLPDDVPGELAAIVRRAMAPVPTDRYPDAKALALDLERYLDGRRVEAHRYSSFELLRRLVRVWRVPLAVIAVALAVLAVVVVIGVGRVGDERDRAQANLSLTLVREAQRMVEDLRLGEAELLAAEALVHATAPQVRAEARGVLASIGPERPTRAVLAELPCVPVDVAGTLALCRDATSIQVFDQGTLRFTRQVDQSYARFIGAGLGVVTAGLAVTFFDVASGEVRYELSNPCATVHGLRLDRGGPALLVSSPQCAAVVTLDGVSDPVRAPCAPGASLLTSTMLAPDRLLGACDDGQLTLVDLAPAPTPRRFVAAGFGTVQRPPVVTAVTALGPDTLLVGLGDGGVERVTLDGLGPDLGAAPDLGARREPLGAQAGLVRTLVTFAGGRRALVLADASAPLVLDLERARPVLRLPRLRASAAVGEGQEALVVASRRGEGGLLERWELAAMLPRAEPAPGGVTVVAARRDVPGYALGDGPTLLVLDGDRRRVAAPRWQDSIVKTAAFDADGVLVAHGLGRPEIRRFQAAAELPAFLAPKTILRRVALLADGSLLASSHTQRQFRIDRAAPPRDISNLDVVDLVASADGRHVAILLEGGEVRLGRDYPTSGVLVSLTRAPAALGLALDGTRLFALEPDRVRTWVLDAGGAREGETYVATPDAELVSLAVTRGRLAAGARDGVVRLWRLRGEGAGAVGAVTPDAIVRVHHGRVDSLAFGAGRWREGGPDGEVLLSGGWDRVASWIDPDPRPRSPSEVGAAWGVALDDVFLGAR